MVMTAGTTVGMSWLVKSSCLAMRLIRNWMIVFHHPVPDQHVRRPPADDRFDQIENISCGIHLSSNVVEIGRWIVSDGTAHLSHHLHQIVPVCRPGQFIFRHMITNFSSLSRPHIIFNL